MSSLRGLLKLEDKLEAEKRRLAHLGGPSLGHLLPLIVVATVALHVVVLLLPTFATPAGVSVPSTPPDFPMVWRPAPPVAEEGSAPVAEPGGRPAGTPAPLVAREMQVTFEPVAEPAPPIAIAVNPEVDPLIPPPDAVPPSVEPSSPQAGQAAAGLTLVKRARPVYPPAARALRVDARVTVQLVVAVDGTIADATVIGSTRTGLGFETAAIDAVKQWRYERHDGGTAPRTIVVAIDFKGAR
ncbi:MAG TPA: TonB family protein [Candidatus Polarisedimenticolaceae bacterium]|nr:TonB family protein [Candidatus Polarisedimenticolaceae bacterium]